MKGNDWENDHIHGKVVEHVEQTSAEGAKFRACFIHRCQMDCHELFNQKKAADGGDKQKKKVKQPLDGKIAKSKELQKQ